MLCDEIADLEPSQLTLLIPHDAELHRSACPLVSIVRLAAEDDQRPLDRISAFRRILG